jgi:hypothetical protein
LLFLALLVLLEAEAPEQKNASPVFVPLKEKQLRAIIKMGRKLPQSIASGRIECLQAEPGVLAELLNGVNFTNSFRRMNPINVQ